MLLTVAITTGCGGEATRAAENGCKADVTENCILKHKTFVFPGKQTAYENKGHIAVNGVELFYAQKGKGPNLILLHGGLGFSNQWGYQVDVFAKDYRVTVVDSRAHGLSTRDERPLSIHLMAEDISKLMNVLDIETSSILGFSDGGNIGLDLAINHPEKVEKLITFGANSNPDGVKTTAGDNSLLGVYVSQMAEQYEKTSTTEEAFDVFSGGVFSMWGAEPNFTDVELESISAPVLIMHGNHEEAIKEEHARHLAKAIPNGELILMQDVSHFGMWQDPEAFNSHVLNFLE